MTSLRARLLAGTVAGMVLLLAALSVVVYATIRRALFEQFDAGLESTAQLLAASVEQDADDEELGLEVQQMPEFRDVRHQAYFQLWTTDGTIAGKSPTLHRGDLWRLADDAAAPAFADLHDDNGQPLRAIGLRFRPRATDQEGEARPAASLQAMTLTVARDATELYGQLHLLRWLLLGASAAVAAAALLIAAIVVRHGLAPLNAIAAQIEALRADDLAARLDARQMPAELVPIRERLNDLLARLQGSFQRERRFTADVAHELRTPLAGLRSTLEVTLARARDRREYETVLSDCLELVQNMQAMVNNLLMLARLDTRQTVPRQDCIRLADLAETCWRPFAARARQRQIAWESAIPDDLTCRCDPDNLSMIVTNLLANAAEYTNDGGRIRIAARSADGHVELTVANTGCTLNPQQVSQVFDCFWRGDSSRRDAGVHCGLGLALVQRLVTALGGSVAAERQPDGIFLVRLTLAGEDAGRS